LAGRSSQHGSHNVNHDLVGRRRNERGRVPDLDIVIGLSDLKRRYEGKLCLTP
jgi:hypothetical protein